MARKKKIINKNSPFLTKLIELSSRESRSLEELAEEFGASRQTVSKWLSAKALPDIDHLEKIAQYYNVSTDYLLGRSKTKSPDVNLREAMEYTGLSEGAIERIHDGFAKPKRFQLRLSGAGKEEKLFMASHLLESPELGDALDHLTVLSELSFFESIMVSLEKKYWRYESDATDIGNSFLSTKEREFIIASIRDAHQKGRLFQGEGIMEQLAEMNDVELVKVLEVEVTDIQSKMDLRQFLVTKAFNHYIDRILKITYGNACKGLRE